MSIVYWWDSGLQMSSAYNNLDSAPDASPTVPAAGKSSKLVVLNRPHKVHIEHHIPGRMRIKIPRAINRRQLLNGYGAKFLALPAIRKITGNEVTGSLVIHYDKDSEHKFIEDFHRLCDEHSLIVRPPAADDIDDLSRLLADEATFLAEHSEVAKRTMAFFNALDLELKLVSSNTIDLNIALVGSLAVFTLMGIGATAATPMWVTLALYGINHAVRLQSEGLSKLPARASTSQSL